MKLLIALVFVAGLSKDVAAVSHAAPTQLAFIKVQSYIDSTCQIQPSAEDSTRFLPVGQCFGNTGSPCSEFTVQDSYDSSSYKTGICIPVSDDNAPPGVGPVVMGAGAHKSVKYTYVGTAAYFVREMYNGQGEICPKPADLLLRDMYPVNACQSVAVDESGRMGATVPAVGSLKFVCDGTAAAKVTAFSDGECVNEMVTREYSTECEIQGGGSNRDSFHNEFRVAGCETGGTAYAEGEAPPHHSAVGAAQIGPSPSSPDESATAPTAESAAPPTPAKSAANAEQSPTTAFPTQLTQATAVLLAPPTACGRTGLGGCPPSDVNVFSSVASLVPALGVLGAAVLIALSC